MAPPHVHILGAGNVGLLLAHSLLPYARITLLLRPSTLSRYLSRPQITLYNPAVALSPSNSLSFASPAAVSTTPWGIIAAEPSVGGTRGGKEGGSRDEGGNGVIQNLILSTKTYQTVPALHGLSHRLEPSSTVLLLQNGMGVLDTVRDEVWTSSPRPRLLTGIISHGVYRHPLMPFDITLAGKGRVYFGPSVAPLSQDRGEPQEEEEGPGDMGVLTRSGMLDASWEADAQQLLAAQLQKLVMNAAINPLTVLFDTVNGGLLRDPAAARRQAEVVGEAAKVLRALPEMVGLGEASPRPRPREKLGPEEEKLRRMRVQERFAEQRLLGLVRRINEVTRENRSSMYQDWKNGVRTEVDQINGWVVRKGRELGVSTPVNEAVWEGVREAEQKRRRE